jgi:hypothetical protein
LILVSALLAMTLDCVELAIRDFKKTGISEFILFLETIFTFVFELLILGTEGDFIHSFTSIVIFFIHPKLGLTRLAFVLVRERHSAILLFSFLTFLSLCIQVKRVFAFLTRFPVFLKHSTSFDQGTLLIRCHFIRTIADFTLVSGYMEFFAEQIRGVLQTRSRRRLVIIGGTLQTSVFGIVRFAVWNCPQTNPIGEGQSKMACSTCSGCFVDFTVVKKC